MISAKTYIVGTSGGVKRLDDLSGAWTDVSITNTWPYATKFTLLDVETGPLNGDGVIAIGEGSTPSSLFGIYISPDGGNTWFIPGGNYQTNFDAAGDIRWHEVFVFDQTNIMVVGENGYAAISTNGGLTFNLTTQLPALPDFPGGTPVIPTLYSVHFISPTVGIVGTTGHVVLTIDGGITWTVLNGGLNLTGPPNGDATTISGIHLSVDQQTIVALNSKSIFHSTDGGVTFTNVFQFSAINGLHLTWINDFELWGFGKGSQRINTIDGGATWNIISAYNLGNPNSYAGHFYQNQNGFYSENSNILSTNNGSTSGIISDTASFLITAVWTWFTQGTCYELVACDGISQSILVDNDLSANVGQVLEVCPTDLPPASGSGTGSGLPIPISPPPRNAFPYILMDCCGLNPPVTVTNNLSAYINGTIVIPSISLTTCWRVTNLSIPTTFLGVVDLTGGTYYDNCINCNSEFPCYPTPVLTECKCYTITNAAGCQGSITLLNIGTINNTCQECQGQCYYLVDCTNTNNFLITQDDFAQYVGMTVKLEDCPDKCWQVLLSTTCDDAVCLAPVIASFDDCVSCLPPVPEPEPVELHSRRVKPGYYTAGCSPAYTEKVSCSFGEQMYNQMIVDRYGITVCCEEDTMKWIIKKQLLDFKAIYDPTLCLCSLSTCCPPSCIEAILQVFNPINCPAPLNPIGLIDLLPVPCPAPGDINYTYLDIT